MAKFSINKWRKKAISMFGTARGLSAANRAKVTAAVRGGTSKGRGRGGSPAKGGRKRVGNRKFTLPLGVVIPIANSLVSGAKPGWDSPLNHAMRGEWNRVMNNLANGWLFWDMDGQKMDPNGGGYMKMMIIGGIIHWLASKIGINRWLGRARVPIIRI